MKHISLFAGIGGFDLASEWTGWDNVASVEIGDFPNKVLEYHFPNALHYRDITKLNYDKVNEEISKRFGQNWRSDGLVLSGGFPCQGFSVAGLRLGTEDDRFLWPEYCRAIDALNPDWVVGENVTGILSMEDKSGVYRDVFAKVDHRKITRFPEIDYYEAVYTRQAKLLVGSICESLEERGYEVQTFAIPAAGVGAPHKRERIWFIACNTKRTTNGGYNSGAGSGVGMDMERIILDKARREQSAINIESPGSYVANTQCNGSSRCGYGETGSAPSESEGQAHQRKRVRGKSKRVSGEGDVADANNQHGRREPQFGSGDGSGSRDKPEREDTTVTSDTDSKRGCRWNGGRQHATDANSHSEAAGYGNNFDRWPIESPLCLRDDGFSERLDGLTFSKWRNESIKGFGNALVPQIPFEIFKIIDQLSK